MGKYEIHALILKLTEEIEKEKKAHEQERINKIYRDREAREFNDAHGWRRAFNTA